MSDRFTPAAARLAAGLALAAGLGACADPSAPVAPELPPGVGAASLTRVACTVTIATARMTCADPSAPRGDGGPLTIGGQNTHVRITPANTRFDGAAGVFLSDVAVTNLGAQPLGSLDGTTPDAAGVRVFLASGPVRTAPLAGAGIVEVENADGVGSFTAADQPYFAYGADQGAPLTTGETSAPRSWRFKVTGDVQTFAFELYVHAAVPQRSGILRWQRDLAYVPATGRYEALWCVAVADCHAATGSTLVRWDGQRWQQAVELPRRTTVTRMAGSAADNVVAVAVDGTILRWDGQRWSRQVSGTTAALRGVWTGGPNDAWAVGDDGLVLRWTGAAWQPVASPTTNDLAGVWRSPAGTVWVVGGERGTSNRVAYASADGGATWTPRTPPGTGRLIDVRGSSDANVVVTDGDAVQRWTGTAWTTLNVPASTTVNALTVVNDTLTYAGGTGGVMMRWSGAAANMSFASTGLQIVTAVSASADEPKVVTVTSTFAGSLARVLFQTDVVAGNASVTTIIMTVDKRAALRGAWAASASQAFAVGADSAGRGFAVQYGQTGWQPTTLPASTPSLAAVHGCAPNLVFAVGSGAVLRWDGGQWIREPNIPAGANLAAVHCVSATRAVAVGVGGTILTWDGPTAGWTATASNTSAALRAVWASGPADVYAAGDAGTLVRFDGTAWAPVPVPAAAGENLTGVWGTSSTDVVVVGDQGTVLRGAGSAWTATAVAGASFTNVWGGAADAYVAPSATPTLWQWNGAAWTQLGTPNGEVGVLADFATGVGPTLAFIGGGSSLYRGTR